MDLHKMKKGIKIATIGLLSLGIAFSDLNTTNVEAKTGSITRIQGDNRFETSATISKKSYDKADTVFITDAREFADALAGVPLAYQKQAPILLAQGNQLKKATTDEIKRLGAKEAIILGGEQAVSSHIERELKELGLSTRRLAGENRFETANAIAKELVKNAPSDTAVLVDGYGFADAMSIAPFAATRGMPIYLTRANKLSTKDVKNFNSTYIIGGPSAVSKAIESELGNTTRIEGSDRYETNFNVLNKFGVSADHLYFSTGLDFVDALTGSVLAANESSGVALVKRDITPNQKLYFGWYGISDYRILGGESAVPKTVETSLEAFLSDMADEEINYSEIETSIVEKINTQRKKKGLKPLNKNNELREAAYVRAEELAEEFSYNRPDGSPYTTALDKKYNYRITEQNMSSASNFTNEKDTAERFYSHISSDLIESKSLEDIGVGVHFNGFQVYITQLFGTEIKETDYKTAEDVIFKRVNELRKSLNVAPLKNNGSLKEGAAIRSEELTSRYSHTRPNGKEFYTVFKDYGIKYSYSALGENIAYHGYPLTPEEQGEQLYDQWLNSPGHYQNMVNPEYNDIGIAVEFNEGNIYGTQIFGTEWN